ncbi:ABC transporter ATP-binding protein [Aneurinibacillus sp. BA2021]|nr:ABC transporter ATP-binding protein [Aneurinibacillus sp. BA2021]
MKSLAAENVTLAYGNRTVIKDLDIVIPEGKVTVFIGSNGCGKSTLLRSLARLLKPVDGSILLDGHSIAKLSTKEVARRLSILPQTTGAPEGLTVLQLVRQGRYPYQSFLQQWSEEDEAMVNWALDVTQLTELAERPVDSLSGGQRQRAWIAMVLAQGTNAILLDEPTTYLDMTHQIEVLDILAELNVQQNRTIVMVLHDLNLACRYADHIVALHKQNIYAQGAPDQIITEQLVRTVFQLDCQIIKDPLYGTPMCVPYSKHRTRHVS